MEDAHICALDVVPGVHLFAVFDGHGGREVAVFCEKYFVQTLKKNQNFIDKNYQQALIENFYAMDELMRDKDYGLLKELQESKDMISQAGCTAVVLLITPEKYYVANAGDSRCVLFNKYKKVVALTEDHKPDNPEEKKRIEAAGGFISDGRINGNLNLSRALGDLEFKTQQKLERHEQLIIATPDVVVKNFDKNEDFFLMGCDGIWELKNAEELCNQIKKSKEPLDKTCENLLDSVLAEETTEGTGCDNMSCIIIKINN